MNNDNQRKITNNLLTALILIILAAIGGFILKEIYEKNSSPSTSTSKSSSYSTKTDWESYCYDLFPGNNEYDRAARKGCINGAETTDRLMDGYYNK